MYKCRRCGANCDCGELVNDVCTECLEEEKNEQIKRTSIVKVINGPFYQMKLGDLISD